MKRYTIGLITLLLIVGCEKNGIHTTYYENGQKESEVTYKDDKRDGLSTDWYENGEKWSEVTYKDGELDGLYTTWYDNGQKKKEVNFKEGKEDGLETQWFKNGKRAYQYVHGRISGGSSSLLCDCNDNYGSLSTSQKRECDKMTDGLSTSEIQTLLLLEQCD